MHGPIWIFRANLTPSSLKGAPEAAGSSDGESWATESESDEGDEADLLAQLQVLIIIGAIIYGYFV